MLGGFSDVLSVLRDNPHFIRRVLSQSSPRQLLRGARLSRRHAGSIAGIVPGKNTSLYVEDGRIEPNGHVVVGTSGPNYLQHETTVFCVDDGRFTSTADEILYVGKGTTINVNGGTLEVGDVDAMYGCEIHCTDEIRIGDGCGLGVGVVLRDGHPHSFAASDGPHSSSEPIVLEDDVILPGYTLVKKGVTIGEGAVVASGSVVTDDVPSRSLAAGVPAAVIDTDVSWEF